MCSGEHGLAARRFWFSTAESCLKVLGLAPSFSVPAILFVGSYSSHFYFTG